MSRKFDCPNCQAKIGIGYDQEKDIITVDLLEAPPEPPKEKSDPEPPRKSKKVDDLVTEYLSGEDPDNAAES